MKIGRVVVEYVQYKQALGVRFRTDAYHLESFCRVVGPRRQLADVTEAAVHNFLASGTAGYWHRKFAVLSGLNRFLAAHGYGALVPLPTLKPKKTTDFVPYILSRDEVARLLAAIPNRCASRVVPSDTARVTFLLLYGAALRIGEALSLKNKDVDLAQGVLTVRATKFYKTRLVPVARPLHQELLLYVRWRNAQPFVTRSDSFLVDRRGRPLKDFLIRRVFEALRVQCHLVSPKTGRAARLHDFRHSFAVSRLVTAYQRGENVQDFLFKLATYLGHASIASTQVYLTLTPDLLEEACKRYESFVFPGGEP
ncbi:MAG: tyrosine-type recombinase/integrase [Terriglobia bacterium]